MLPDRAFPILERLRAFASSDPEARALLQEGIEAFFAGHELRERPPQLIELAEGFAVYDRCDARGRNIVDLYLEKEGEGLSEEERLAIADMATARCATLETISCDPGSGLVARRLPGKETVEIVETKASRMLEPGALFFCRLLPYRGKHEILPPLLIHTEGLAYAVRRLARAESEESAEALSDPRFWIHSYSGFERADSLVEARLRLAQELPALVEDISFEEVEERIRRMARGGRFEDLLDGLRFRSEEAFERCVKLIDDLYNWTPQERLGGRCPAEVARDTPDHDLREALLHDLMAYSVARKSEWMSLPPEEERLARERIQREWETTPQEELGGRTPAEVLAAAPRAAPLPPETEWPPVDRPLWSRARILAALDAPRATVRKWAIQRLLADDAPEVEPRVAALFADPDPEVRFYARMWAERWGTAALAGPVLAAMEAADEEECSVLGQLGVRVARERAGSILAKRLRGAKHPRMMWNLAFAVGEAGSAEALEALKECARSRSPARRFAAATGLLRMPDEGIPLGIETVAGLCAGEGEDRRVWESLEKWDRAPWMGLQDALELMPGHWLQDSLEAFSPSPFFELLRRHAVSDPRRFLGILRTEEYGRIRRAWNRRVLTAEAIADLARGIDAGLAASEGRESVGFPILAGRLSALAQALRAHAQRLAALPPVSVRTFVEHAAAAILKACHGWLLAAELEARRGSLDDLLELNEFDLPFLNEDLPRAVARFGQEAADEAIARVADGSEDFATVRAVEIIGRLAGDPRFDREGAAEALVPLLETRWDYLLDAAYNAMPRLGDPVLERLPVESDDEKHTSEWRFSLIAGEIGTERALFFIRRHLPRLRAVLDPGDLAETLGPLAHPSIALLFEELAAHDEKGGPVREALEAIRDVLAWAESTA